MITLSVSLRVRAGHLDAFLDAVTENALRAFGDETGCVYFDVAQDVDDGHAFTFYEVHVNEAALAAHRATPRFGAWRAAVERHVLPGSQDNLVGRRLLHHNRMVS